MSTLKRFSTVYLPLGVLAWPSIVTPSTKFKSDGEFTTKVVLPGDKWAPLLEQLQALAEENRLEGIKAAEEELKAADNGKAKAAAKAKLKFLQEEQATLPGKPAVDDDGNDTSDVEVTCKLAATRTDKKTKKVHKNKVLIVDSKGREFTPQSVWGGTKAIVAAQVVPYITPKAHGVRLKLSGVQIIDLKTGNVDGAPSFGQYDGEGYEAPEDDEGAQAPAAPEDSTSHEDEEEF